MLIGAQLVNTLVKLLLFILLTQVGGFSVAGSYTLALAVITPTFILFGLSLRSVFVTFRGQVKYGNFLAMRVVYGLVGVAVVSVIGLWFQPENAGLLVAMAFYRFTELLVDIRIAFFQRNSRISLMAMVTILFALATTAVLAAVFLFTSDLVLSVWVAGVLGAVVFVVASFMGPQESRMKFLRSPWLPSPGDFISVSRNGFMLSVSAFAVSFGTSVPVLLIGAFHSPTQVGVYSAIYNITAVSNIFYSSITQTELKGFSDLAASKNRLSFIRRGRMVAWWMFGLGASGAIALYFIGPAIFALVFAQDFSSELVPIMIMSATICIAPFGFILDAQLTALHKFSSQGLLSIFTLALTCIVGFSLVPGLGVLGGTLVVFITMLVRNIAKHLLVRRAMLGLR